MPDHSTIASQSPTISPAAAKDVMPAQEQLHYEPEVKLFQKTSIQFKLAIGSPDDPLEHEADAMADTIIRMPEQNFVQRKCSHCEEEEKVQRKSLASFIQRKESSSQAVASDIITSQINSSRGSGNNMDRSTQSFMESRFGADFSDVKIHTGQNSTELNRELGAKAFTVGNDIYFNDGEYNPGSESGKYLLAHELTHTIQQNGQTSLQQIQRAGNDGSSIQVLNKPSKKNPVNDKKIGFEYIADRELPPPVVQVLDHPLMVWAIQNIFGIPEDKAADVVTTGGFFWNDSGGITKKYERGDKVKFTFSVSSVANWMQILADEGFIRKDVQAIFEETMKLQESLSDRDYSFFLEWAKEKGIVVSGNIMDFKNLTPEGLIKLKGLMVEFERDRYEILYNRGKVKEYFLTEDLQRDTEFEKLKDRFYNKKIADLTEEDKNLIMRLFKDRALSFAFVSLEESKMISTQELKKYKDNPASLDELADIISGFTPEFLKNIETRMIVFNKFHKALYDIIGAAPASSPGNLTQPPTSSLYWTMFGFASGYTSGGDISNMLANAREKEKVIKAFSAVNFEKELAESLLLALIPYAITADVDLDYRHYPLSIDSVFFRKFRQRLPVNQSGYETEDMRTVCLNLIYEEYGTLQPSNESDANALASMYSDATYKKHEILKDVSIDYRKLSLESKSKIKSTIIEKLDEKPGKVNKTQGRLMEDSTLIWEFQPLLYYLLEKENLEKSHPIYGVIKQKIEDVADSGFWESLALSALGLILGIAGIFTGGTTTLLGAALLAGAATVSLIDFSREYDQYATQSDAYNSTFNIPFVNEPSMFGVVLSLVGLVLDVGDVLKIFGKAGGAAAKAGGAAGDAANAIDPALEALSKTKNIDEYSDQLFEILNSKKLIKQGITKDVFVKTIKANWEQTNELTKSWSKYEGIIKTLPAEVQKLMSDSGFLKLAVEIKGSVFRIYDYSSDAFNKVIRFLGESVEKLKLLGLQIFKNKTLGDAYGQLSQVLTSSHYEKAVKYFTGIGYNAADNLPEMLHLMNRGDLFKIPDLSIEVLTNRQLQQMLFAFENNPAHMATLWSEFSAKTGGNGGDFIKYIETNTPYGGHLKLTEASQPLPKLSVPPTNKGVLTDINGMPPAPKALEGLTDDMGKLIKAAENPSAITEVSDARYISDFDAEIPIDGHTFRRNRKTGKWCRFSDEVCNLETPAGLNSKVDETLGNAGKVDINTPEAQTTKIDPGELADTATPQPGKAGSAEHRAQRWKDYEDRMKGNSKKWSKKRWDKQYDINMEQAKKSSIAVDKYKSSLDWAAKAEREVRVEIEGVERRMDIMETADIPADLRKDGIIHLADLEKAGIKPRVVEHKTGNIYNSQDIQWEIARDEILMKEKGWRIEWVFEGYASAPLKEALTKAGIPFTVIP